MVDHHFLVLIMAEEIHHYSTKYHAYFTSSWFGVLNIHNHSILCPLRHLMYLRIELLIFRCKYKIIVDQKRLCILPCLCLYFLDGIHWPLAAPVLHLVKYVWPRA